MATTPHALIHNWRLKVSALGLSVFLWALVQSEPRSEETFPSVPIRVEIADTSWTTSGPPEPSTVVLRLDGPAREIIRLAREGTTLRIPINRVGSPDTVVTLERSWVELGQRPGLVVSSVSPSAIRLRFEHAATRNVPLSARLQGRIREELALVSEIAVNPRTVRVRGPASRVLGLDSVPLHAFDLDRVTGAGNYTVAIDTVGLAGSTVVPATAALVVRVEERIQRTIPAIAVRANVSPGQAEVVIQPATIEVRLDGARSLVNSVDPSTLDVWVPPEYLEDMAPGEERPVRIFVNGVPDLVTAIPATDRGTARRAIDFSGEGTEGRDSP